ncbi:hypothetical protein JCM10296v2_002489 [Rhodotorula toruloides]
MNGSLAYPTLTHVEGTHAVHPTRAALREIKKDQALDVFEESVAFKHEGVKNGEGWWAKGEESVQLIWISDKETKRIIALVIISKHPCFTMMRRLGRQQKQWDAAFGLDAIFSYERLLARLAGCHSSTSSSSISSSNSTSSASSSTSTSSASSSSTSLFSPAASSRSTAPSPTSFGPDLPSPLSTAATISDPFHLTPSPPSIPNPSASPACPPSSNPSSPAPFAEPPALFEGVGLDETGVAVMCYEIWPGATNAGCDEEERKRHREAISEKMRLWWSSRTEEERKRHREAISEKKRLWWASRPEEEREAIREKKRLWWMSRTEEEREAFRKKKRLWSSS